MNYERHWTMYAQLERWVMISSPSSLYYTGTISSFSNPALALLQEASSLTHCISHCLVIFIIWFSCKAKKRKWNDRSYEFQLRQPLNTQHGSCRTCQSLTLQEMERGQTWKCPFSFRLRMIATKWSLSLSDSQSVYLSVSQSISLSLCLSFSLSTWLSVWMSFSLTVMIYVCLFVCLIMFQNLQNFTSQNDISHSSNPAMRYI